MKRSLAKDGYPGAVQFSTYFLKYKTVVHLA